MVLKNVFISGACTLLLGWSGVSVADEYRADQFLGLDLSRAVLSPKPLGPPAAFAPIPVEAKTDHGNEVPQARAEHITQPGIRVTEPKIHLTHVGRRKPVTAAHMRLAHRHSNPLDAQASDARIQVWPCKSGGICNWKR
jgi:hypothetical protein